MRCSQLEQRLLSSNEKVDGVRPSSPASCRHNMLYAVCCHRREAYWRSTRKYAGAVDVLASRPDFRQPWIPLLIAVTTGTASGCTIGYLATAAVIQPPLAENIYMSRRYAGWVSPSEMEDRLALQHRNDLAPYKDWFSPALLREKLDEQSSVLAKKYEGWVSPSELTERLRSEQVSAELKYKDWVAPSVVADRLSQQLKEVSNRYEGRLSPTERAELLAENDAVVRSEFKSWVSPEEMAKAVDLATGSLRQELQEANAKQHFDEVGDDPCKKLQYAMWQSSCYVGGIDGRMGLESIRSVDQYFGSIDPKGLGHKYFWKNFGAPNDPVARAKVQALCQSDLQLKGRVCSPAVDLRDLRDSMLRDPDVNSTDPEGLIDRDAGFWILRGRFPPDGLGRTSIRIKWLRRAKIASLQILSITGSVQCVDISAADGRGLDGKGRYKKQCDDPGEWFRETIDQLNANELTLVVERKRNSKDPNYVLLLRWPI
jgi:hypothetical protein